MCISTLHLNRINQYSTELKCVSYAVTQVKTQLHKNRPQRQILQLISPKKENGLKECHRLIEMLYNVFHDTNVVVK